MKTFLRLFIVINILCFTTSVYSQNEVDSITQLLKKAKKGQKLALQNELARAYFYAGNLEESNKIVESVLSTAQDQKDFKEQAKAFNTLAMLYFSINENKQGVDYAFKALEAALKSKDVQEQSTSYRLIGNSYEIQGDLNKALNSYQKSLTLSSEIKDLKGEAKTLVFIGQIYSTWSQYEDAIKSYEKALQFKLELGDKRGACIVNLSIANLYIAKDENSKAMKYAQDALNEAESVKYKPGHASSLNAIGLILTNLKNYDAALKSFDQAYLINTEIDYKPGIADVLNNIGNVYNKQNKQDKAIEFYTKALKVREEIGDKQGIAISLQTIGLVYTKRNKPQQALTYYQRALKINQELNNQNEISANLQAIGNVYLDMKNYPNAINYIEQSQKIALRLNLLNQLKENYLSFSEAYKGLGDYIRALSNYEKYAEVADTLNSMESFKALNELNTKYETTKKEAAIKEQKGEIKRQKLQRNMFIGGFVLVLALVFLIFRSLQQKKRDNAIIQAEKAKSDALLLNTLPLKVVNDLKTVGVTEPEVFESVTVYFSDVKGFTDMSSSLEPKYLISKLNEMFTAFDDIMSKYQCERIKTIGDAYMAVCGMPDRNDNHAENILKASMEILDYLTERNTRDELQIQIRIGLNSGKVTGGIVGVRKYIYDVFGDTVNTASRMESNGEPMKINCSENTFNLLKGKYGFIDRGAHEVKGKGTLRMFFLDYAPQNKSVIKI